MSKFTQDFLEAWASGCPLGPCLLRKPHWGTAFVIGIACLMILLRNRVERMLLCICYRTQLPWSSLSALCPREAEGSRRCNSVWARRPETQEHGCLRAGEDGCPDSGKESTSTLSLPFCHTRALSGLEGAHLHCGEWSLLLSTDSNAKSNPRHTKT